MMSYRSSLAFVILSLLLRELKKGETFASLLNIHGGDIRVIPTHLVYFAGGMPLYKQEQCVSLFFQAGKSHV